MQRRRLRPAVPGRDANQNVLGSGFGVLHENVEVAVLRKNSRINQFIFRIVARALAVFIHQLLIRIARLRILVEVLQIRTGRRRVQIVVILFDVFAVIPFPVGQVRRAVPSKSDLFHSTAREQNRCAGADRRIRRCHLPPSDTCANANGRAADNSTRRRSRCNLRGPFPTAAPKDTAPSASSGLRARCWPATSGLRRSSSAACISLIGGSWRARDCTLLGAGLVACWDLAEGASLGPKTLYPLRRRVGKALQRACLHAIIPPAIRPFASGAKRARFCILSRPSLAAVAAGMTN